MRSISSDLSSDPPGAPRGFLLQCSQKSGSGMSPCPGHTGHVPAGISGQSPGSEDQTQSDTSRASNSPPSQTTASDLDKHACSYLQPVLPTIQLEPGHVLLWGVEELPFGKWWRIISWANPAKLLFTAWLRTSLLAGVSGGTSRRSSPGKAGMHTSPRPLTRNAAFTVKTPSTFLEDL